MFRFSRDKRETFLYSLFRNVIPEAIFAQTLKSHLLRAQSLQVLPLKPGVGQYVAIHATLTAWDFILAHFYPSGPFTCIFFYQTSPKFFPVLAAANPVSCVGPQNKIGHLAGCRFPCCVPTKDKQAKKTRQKKNHGLW